jgi:LacI family transcriptional regulator
MAQVTIIDVAKEAGVSPATVSRILNATTPVAKDKRQRVMAAIQKMGFQPNVLAQGLIRGRTNTVGVVTPDLSSAFYGTALGGIEQAFIGSGYQPLYGSAHWQAGAEREAISMLLNRKVDGLIIMGGFSEAAYLLEISKRLPVIVLGRHIAGMEDHCLNSNNAQGAYIATQHLIQLGHQRIAHIAGPHGNEDAQQRQLGYRQALEAHQLEYNPAWVQEGDFLERSGMMAIESLLMRAPTFTAVFAGNDQMAMGARLALARHGLRVPDDVSLVGFDDLPSSPYLHPPLTTVHQPMNEMGFQASNALIAHLKGQAFKLEHPDVSLIIRESTVRIGLAQHAMDRIPQRLATVNTS